MTERQRLVLEFIQTYMKIKGVAPSMQDIATGLNLKSRSNIHRIVHALKERGLLSIRPRQVRTMRPIDKSVREVTAL